MDKAEDHSCIQCNRRTFQRELGFGTEIVEFDSVMHVIYTALAIC